MTGLLVEALKRVDALPDDEQDAIAAQILESLKEEEDWGRFYQLHRDEFRTMAKEAAEERGRGETRPLEDLIGE